MRPLLDTVFILGFALAWPFWRRKQRGAWPERWGRGPRLPTPPPRGRVVLHAVSVGEVNAALPIIRRLVRDPRTADADIVLSVTTDTGHERATRISPSLGPAAVRVVRAPLDASWAVRRWFDRVQPSAIALVELEVWPNFILESERRRVPIGVVNGRLSDRSFRRYRKAKPLVAWMFRRIAIAGAQDERYADRFAELDTNDVRVTGSVKWDGATDAALAEPDNEHASEELARAMGIDRTRHIVVLGSAEPGEATLVRDAIADHADTQLVVAPRRPEWFDDAARELGEGVVRRSAPPDNPPAKPRWFLLDSMGELDAAYRLADIAVVGRTFGALHGSDVMAPAAMRKPVVVGPRVADFQAIVRTLEHAGGLIQTTRADLRAVLTRLLDDDAERHRIGEAAAACVRAHLGAADASVGIIAELLQQTQPIEPPPSRHHAAPSPSTAASHTTASTPSAPKHS